MKKQIVLFTMIALLFTACARPTWDNQSQAEIASWREAGVTVEELEKYTDAKMTSSDVLAWKNSGFSNVDNIIAWKEQNITPQDAKKWKEKGIELDVAKKWSKNNFSFEDAMGWKNAKFSLDDAIDNREKGLVPNK